MLKWWHTLLFLFGFMTMAVANVPDKYVVHLGRQEVDIFKGGQKLKTIPCSSAMKTGGTPTGIFKTHTKKPAGVWMEDDGTEIKYYYITQFNKGVAFHSKIEGNHAFVREGDQLFKEGKPSSMGCVRLRKEDAKWIYDQPLGAVVEVVED